MAARIVEQAARAGWAVIVFERVRAEPRVDPRTRAPASPWWSGAAPGGCRDAAGDRGGREACAVDRVGEQRRRVRPIRARRMGRIGWRPQSWRTFGLLCWDAILRLSGSGVGSVAARSLTFLRTRPPARFPVPPCTPRRRPRSREPPRAFAVDYGPAGVRFNAVALGSIATERYAEQSAALTPAERELIRQQMAELHPLGRIGLAEEVASTVLFLVTRCRLHHRSGPTRRRRTVCAGYRPREPHPVMKSPAMFAADHNAEWYRDAVVDESICVASPTVR